MLVTRAEQWALSRGVKEMLVRSRISREDAHRFYLREGYERTKTSAVFGKHLASTARVN
jgi:GNAT superfamily N-acetyltransferase